MPCDVGAIAGVEQKVHAAIDAQADFFLAPRENVDGASSTAGERLRVVAVASIDDAVEELNKTS